MMWFLKYFYFTSNEEAKDNISDNVKVLQRYNDTLGTLLGKRSVEIHITLT